MKTAHSSKNNTDREEVINLLSQKLPKAQTETDLKEPNEWSFALTTRAPKKPQKKRIKKKVFLTRNERKQLNILKLPKTNWKYNELDAMRQLWKEYMRKNLSLYQKIPQMKDSNWNNFNVTLAKSEFIGAELTVVRSKVVTQIGMSGTVVLETKSTFQIVTAGNELKTLIKKPSVFCFTLDNLRFTIFGKHMGVRPSERSMKKLKLHFLPDL